MAKNQRYKKNFLKPVIVRVDFTPNIPTDNSSLANNPPISLPESLKKKFPNEVRNEVVSRVFTAGPNMQKSEVLKSYVWDFVSRSKSKRLHVESDFFFLRYDKYISFQDLMSDFNDVLSVVFRVNSNMKARRLGLRYVDTIDIKEGDPFEWRQYLSRNLISGLDVVPKKDQRNIKRYVCKLESSFDGYDMNIQFGIVNPDYPSKVKRKQFILDTDISIKEELDVQEIELKLIEFHSKAKKVFESCIKDGLRELMNEKEG